MAPLISPRGLARGLLSDIASHSPFQPIARRSRPSRPALVSLRSVAARLIPRLATGVETVPQGYGSAASGPDTGTIVGIVLGSVAGFLLMLWLIYTCVNLGNSNNVIETGSVGSVMTRKSRRKKHRHHSRSPRRETVEVRRERVVPVPMPGPERIIVQERSRSRAPAGPPPPPPMMDDDDEVVVIEEHTPSRRRDSRHKRRSSERRSTGYREVDPYQFAGGEAPLRDVGGRRRSESRRRDR